MVDPRFAMTPSHIARMPVAARPPAAPAVAQASATIAVPWATAPKTPPARVPAAGTQRAADAAKRSATDSKRPYHVGVALGLSAGVYAGSLAAVSMLQFEHDRSLIADRAPVQDAIELLGRNHDQMAASLERAGAVFEDASTRYAELATGLESLHADVVGLSDKLTAINKLAAIDASGLGGAVTRSGAKLPTVSKSRPKSSTSSVPASNATTGASGAP